MAGWPEVFGVGGEAVVGISCHPLCRAEPRALFPAAGELLLLGSLSLFSLRRAKHHLQHLGTRGAQGNNFLLQHLSCFSRAK